jgi:phage terminase large subunit-like protein
VTAIIQAPPEKLRRLADLRREARMRADPHRAWLATARPDQLLPDGDWRITYYQGGRGAGKTKSSSQGLAQLIREHQGPPCDWGIVAPTYRAAWTTCVEGESGFLAALGTSAGEVKSGTSATVAYAHRSYGEIGLRSGHVVYVDSANDGALRVQGKNLTACWCSEIGLWLKWATAWDESIAYAVRRGASKIIADGTPKVSRPAAKLIRRLLRDEPGVIVRRLRTVDNLANLSETFYRSVVARATGTRLERQELEGELLDDVENALWTRDLLESLQVDDIPGGDYAGLSQVYVGADPSDGAEESDECAYTVCGMGQDRRLYIPESWGGRIGPVPFLKQVVLTADRWRGTVVLEKNHGGAYLEATLRQVMRDLGVTVPYMVVHASQAKRTRAEPVAALYERGMIRHARGPHVELEDQMVTFTGMAGERSPDRLDSAVWAVSPFLDHDFDLAASRRPPGARQWAAHADLERMTADPSQRLRERLGRRDRDPGWNDPDAWAPRDDDGRPSRPNVREWR